MHRPTHSFRTYFASAVPVALLLIVACSASLAEDASLSQRLSQLRKAWMGDKSETEAKSPSRPFSSDLFEALGGSKKTPRVASREMPVGQAGPDPTRRRVGSNLTPKASPPGVDIGAALGGPQPRRKSTTESVPQRNVESTKVAVQPTTSRRRVESDLALDLISSTASSSDTSGVPGESATVMNVPTNLFSAETDPTSTAGSAGFATAADAAAAAEPSSPSSELAANHSGTDIGLALADTDESTAASSADPLLQDATSSPNAKRAFSDSKGNNHSSNHSVEPEVWISTSSNSAGSFNRGTSSETVLVTEELPLITSKISGPKSILIGREAKYQVTVENRGSAAAEQLSTEVVVPEWADVVRALASAGAVQRPGTQRSGTVLQWEISSLSAGGSQTLELALVPKTSQPLSLGVSWRHAPIAATTLVEVQEPKLAMAISGPEEVFFGRPQSYRLSISNPGTGDAENVVVQLMPPGGGQAASSYRMEKLPAGESKVVEIEITAREAGELAIRAVAAADGNLKTEAAQQIFCRQAELNVDWRGPDRKFAGTQATYFFRVRNPGTASADQVAFDVSLPTGFEFRGASDGHQFDQSAGRVIWKIGTLRPGDDRYLELRGVVNQAGANHLRLSAANAGGDVHDTKTATTEVVALADLKLDVSDPKGPVPVGSEVDYEIVVTNRGRSTAEQVSVVGLFSAGIEPTSAEGVQATIADGRVGFSTIGALPAGQQVTLKIRARAESAGTHLFRAEVVCRDLEIKLAAEETTRFFEDESTTAATGEPVEAASRESWFE